MPPFIDLMGKRFGRSVVQKRLENTSYGQPRWFLLCDCGNTHITYGNALRQGLVQSCGCLHIEKITTHGKSKTTEFTIWQNMFQRCTNPRHESYKRYGAR